MGLTGLHDFPYLARVLAFSQFGSHAGIVYVCPPLYYMRGGL